MAAPMLQGEITFFSEAKGDKIIFVADKRDLVIVGSDPSCDIRIEDADELHMRIQLDTETGKVKATNLSAEHPILVNGEAIKDKKLIKSGDVITVLSHTMRWDSKEYLRRRTAALTKSARKEIKHRVVRTNKRITIHNLASTKLTESDGSDEEKQSKEEEEETSPQRENNVSKINALNLSGTLFTSFIPQKVNSPRIYNRTPLKNTPGDNTDNSNNNAGSPRISKSMHLIDLTTPAPKRARTPSAPPSLPSSTSKRTPLSVKTPVSRAATAVKNDTLLMSAIKNSSIKKRLNDSLPNKSSTAKGKVLFAPILDESNASSTVVSVSFSSAADELDNENEIESAMEEEKTLSDEIIENEPITQEQDGTEKSQTESSEQTSDEETKALLDKISFVIDQDDAQNEVDKEKSMLTIEENFQKIHADMSPDRSNASHNISDIKTPDAGLVDEEFANIIKPAGDESHKKAETLLTWIETARESLASNNTEQVLSSRYSNITPNDSIVTANPQTTYDVKTPKMSILEIRKSEGLAVSAVTRLSINDNSTVVVENYKLNSDIPKSLRSTRKRIGNAMASLHDTSQANDTTLDMNESMNASINTQKNDQSILETTTNNILSLDDPPQEQEQEEDIEMESNENAENIPPQTRTSNNYIAFAEHNNDDEDDQNGIVNNDEEKEFFEISSSDVAAEDNEDDDKSSNSSNDEEENMEVNQEDEIEEIFASQENEMTPKMTVEKTTLFSSAIKFRLSEQDLEEDGINPLDISSRTEDDTILAEASQESSVPPQVVERDPNIPEEDVDIPATQNVEDFSDQEENNDDSDEHVDIPATDEFSTQQMNEIIEGSGSVDIICNAQTDEVESMIEEHLESSVNVTTIIANDDKPDEIDFAQNLVKSEEEIPCSQGSELSNEEDEVVEIYSSSQGSELSEMADQAQKHFDVKHEAIADESEIQISDDDSMNANSVKNEPIESTVKEPENEESLQEIQEPLEKETGNSEDIFADLYSEEPADNSQPKEMPVLPVDLIEEDADKDDIWESVGTTEILEKTLSDQNIAIKNDVVAGSQENQSQKEVIGTPSRRRGTRINYADLASGCSPAKTPRRGRSVSTEVESIREIAQTPKTARSAYKMMEPIVENSVALKISVHVEESPDTFEIEVSSEVPLPVEESPLEIIESDEHKTDKSDSSCDENDEEENEEIVEEKSSPPEENDEEENVELEREPVVEEACIKKVAYVTTNDEENQSEDAKTNGDENIVEPCESEKVEEPCESEKVEEHCESEKVEEIAQKSQEALKEIVTDESKEIVTEESSSRRRVPRINYADLAAGSPIKTPNRRRGRSASIEEQPIPTPKRVRSTRKVLDSIVEAPSTSQISSTASVKLFEEEPIEEVEEVFEKETPRKRNKVDYMAMSSGSSARTLRRGRSASVDTQVLSKQKPKSPKKNTITDNLLNPANAGGSVLALDDIDHRENEKKELEIAQNIQAAVPQTVEPLSQITDKSDEKTDPKEAKKTSRNAKKAVEIIDNEESDEEDKNEQPTIVKKARGRKAKAVKDPEESAEEEPTPAKKNRKTKIDKVVQDTVIETEPVKKGRRGVKAIATDEVTKNSEPEKVEEPAKTSRGRRAAKTTTEEEVQAQKQDNPDENKVEATKTRRGRGAAKAIEVVEPEKIKEPVKKGRGRAPTKSDEVLENPEPEKIKEPVKKGRGRAPTKAIKDVVIAPEPEKPIEKEEEPVVVKRGRGRQAKVTPVEIPVPQTSPAVSESKRGRKQKDEEEKIETEASTASTTKGRRGGKTVPEEKVAKEVPSRKGRRENLQQTSTEEPQIKRTRRGAKAAEEEIIEVESSQEQVKPRETPKKRALKHVTIMTPATMEAKNRKEKIEESQAAPEVSAPKTSSRKRQAQVVEVIEEPVVKRATRAKK